MSSFKPQGIIVPMVTPFQVGDSDSLNIQSLRALVDYLVEGGVQGLLPLGTSGEFALLDQSERIQVIEAVVDQANGRIPVIAGVSAPSTKAAVSYAKHAKDVGADAVISTGPYYFTTKESGLSKHFQSIIDAVDIPLLIYNIPGYVGYNIEASFVARLVEKNPESIVGVKVTTYDMKILLEYAAAIGEKISVLTGADALIVPALSHGAQGAVIGIANVIPKECSLLYDNFTHGRIESARTLERTIYPLTQSIGLGTFPSALKEALRIVGLECGGVRSPLQDPTDEEKEAVRRSLLWKIQK